MGQNFPFKILIGKGQINDRLIRLQGILNYISTLFPNMLGSIILGTFFGINRIAIPTSQATVRIICIKIHLFRGLAVV